MSNEEERKITEYYGYDEKVEKVENENGLKIVVGVILGQCSDDSAHFLRGKDGRVGRVSGQLTVKAVSTQLSAISKSKTKA